MVHPPTPRTLTSRTFNLCPFIKVKGEVHHLADHKAKLQPSVSYTAVFNISMG